MIVATLGPKGSNHMLVLRRYVEARGLADAQVKLFDDFPAAFAALVAGEVDRVLQCTAHFSHADCVGRYMHRAFPVDAFVAGSHPLALLARREVAAPRQVARQPATRYYTDLSSFAEEIDAPTTVAVAEGLLTGCFEAGICARQALDDHPDKLRLLEDLGPALDVWVLYGTEPLANDSPLLV
ncbi:amino acid ABC transporter substrate-binding protein [Billgrantia bachuensis]|uniref:Amino acid ABC transporter substrate-binding protein n=1 Tax=Billgrantia bachuensis TaxID=2717286 RepID=A0ABX0PTN9_9GAMM|nr:amino acid ABC transporter substrate-binding protein [Halomonas bachuensis]NIC06784.1 amino acid ABC transporter substrate-binding protein [Halomonas bachuensis]